MWLQSYDPLNNVLLSTLLALIPVVVLLGGLGLLRLRAHVAALLGLATALAVAVWVFRMPVGMAAASTAYGAVYGMLPIGWIIINVIFLYQLAERKGLFTILQDNLTGITQDRRLQLLLVAFCFGAFFEGAAGFGTPVAITASILIGLGFGPLAASGLSLIANTAPVPFAALGTPLIALQTVTGLDLLALSAMVGRQVAIFGLLVPFWMTWAFCGWRGMLAVWPALLVTGGTYTLVSVLVSNLHGPWLVNIVSALVSILALILFLRVWQPRSIWRLDGETEQPAAKICHTRPEILRAWAPWLILSVLVFFWGLPQMKGWLDGFSTARIAVPGLHLSVMRVPPILPEPQAEPAVFVLNGLSATGTAILLAALLSAWLMGYRPGEIARVYLATLKQVRYSLLTIAAMMAVGFVTRYAGLDATLGLTFARTGALYPFFGTLLGWLGVALTGSDTSSNVLFGSLQRITAAQVGVSPVLMAAANSSGGVMGKMIDAQSIVVASTATKWYGHEGDILRYVFFHSIVLAVLVGLLVLLMAYVAPFSSLVIW